MIGQPALFTELNTNYKAILIILIGLMVRLGFSLFFPPGFDESYYAAYAMYPAFGYIDHPPMVMVTAGFGYWLTGDWTPLTLRLGALILFCFSAWLVYDLAKRLFDEKVAFHSLLLFHLVPYFLIGAGAFVFPDNSLTFFWLLAIYALVRFHFGQNNGFLYLFGLAVGLAMLSKYHAFAILGSLGILMIVNRNWRGKWTNRHFYLSILLALVVFLPNILWNWDHEWASYALQFGKGGSGGGLSFTKFLQGIVVQLVYLFPWHWLLMIIGGGVIWRHYPANRWLLAFFILTPLVFTLIGATRTILPHWPMPGYIMGILAGGLVLAGMKPIWQHFYHWLSGLILAVLLVIILTHAQTGWMKIDPKSDPTLDGQGWVSLNMVLNGEALTQEPIDFLFTHKWFLSGELAFFTGFFRPVLVLNDKSPQGFVFWEDSQQFLGKNALFITNDRFKFDPKLYEGDYFKSVQKISEVETIRGHTKGKTFFIYQCDSLKRPFPNPFLD